MRTIFTILALSFTVSFMAQTHEITKHNGETMKVNFIKIENNLVYYTNVESTEEKKISQFSISKLHEKSKKEAKTVSEKIALSGKADYNKVIVLNPSQTEGLRESGTISSFLGKTKGETNLSFKDGAAKRLKENAADKGFPFIVILSTKSKDLKAVMYTY
ncbi:hypothetical protein [Flavobacterium sandaracinum]|uniref:Uncharacterized protein n=1 Tax=Flavobacterium sandaracinum TaxID=2541733 RepID=A0A4R5D2V5_9FLAO|nr:hypothetical protein [Flavobacterium sandaracinum]TDE07652.1 hypothetical protein E0F91_00770 [Flavobacterium sandaracinum]